MHKILPILFLPAIFTLSSVPVQAQQLEPSQSSQLATPQAIAQASNITSIAEEFIGLLSGGQYSAALQQYDSVVSNGISSDSLELTWQDVESANGILQRQVSSRSVLIDQQTLSYAVIVTCEFERGTRDVLVTILGDQVIGFSLVEG